MQKTGFVNCARGVAIRTEVNRTNFNTKQLLLFYELVPLALRSGGSFQILLNLNKRGKLYAWYIVKGNSGVD